MRTLELRHLLHSVSWFFRAAIPASQSDYYYPHKHRSDGRRFGYRFCDHVANFGVDAVGANDVPLELDSGAAARIFQPGESIPAVEQARALGIALLVSIMNERDVWDTEDGVAASDHDFVAPAERPIECEVHLDVFTVVDLRFEERGGDESSLEFGCLRALRVIASDNYLRHRGRRSPGA